MKIDGRPYRTIWPDADGEGVMIIDQTLLPHRLEIVRLQTLEAAAAAIETMQVRGAPCIGATAAFGMAIGLAEDPSDEGLERAAHRLLKTRPTAVNLHWGVAEIDACVRTLAPAQRRDAAFARAIAIADEDVEICKAIGRHGAALITAIAARKPAGVPVNILTHCNAGWLATVDWGTATAPIYAAHDSGVAVHVWVDETRPRNQGAALTAFELAGHGAPHTLIVDNAGGRLMQEGKVDLVIVGSDRTARNGDVANKIGTYLKALAAMDNNVPFYVALPGPTIDWSCADGVRDIPIEERAAVEVTHIWGKLDNGTTAQVQIGPDGTSAANPAFDVTPARLVTGLITERGIAAASEAGLLALYPERR
jgi:methylthioribose-1-phosphate isomerase